ncbi:MAG: dipeptidase [Leptolyngbyaceae cyanobacterium MO_188.B28]|nr:dipeptidase [Leptolyngbyaceae cyanobacterium MO_188.B28]
MGGWNDIGLKRLNTQRRWRLRGLLILVGVILAIIPMLSFLSIKVDQSLNQVLVSPPYPTSPEASTLHQTLQIADLHADPLLWNRNLLNRHGYGHIDIPRLVEANVALQGFGVVTKVPQDINFEANSADTDQITQLVIAQRWPPRTWRSLLQRALYQAAKLQKIAERSQGQVQIITNIQSLDRVTQPSNQQIQTVGALLGLEGAQALEGQLSNLDKLFNAGFRQIGLTHFFDNEAAGSAHGMEQTGLTPFGRALVQRIQAKHMVIDLAHASTQTIDDVLALSTAPVLASHTGVKGTCNSPRNLSDAEVKGIADTGGVIGIGLFEPALCEPTLESAAQAMRYVADLVGVDHVALGSDFDGAVTTPVDVSGLPLLTQALMDQGFTADEIAQIMGQNAIRMLRTVLPKE